MKCVELKWINERKSYSCMLSDGSRYNKQMVDIFRPKCKI